MQYIYLIQCQNFYKIGIANDVQNRLAQLSTGNPFLLAVEAIYSFENAEPVEKSIHQCFSKKRERGEWFELSNNDIQNFHNICMSLGGSLESIENDIEDSAIREAEEVQEYTLDDPELRIEKRYSNGELRGFAFRERGKSRKVIRYIGKRMNRKEFEELLSQYETQ